MSKPQCSPPRFHGWEIVKGKEYICEKCGRIDIHDRDYADMVMIFELSTGREFDPKADDIIMTCNECDEGSRYIQEDHEDSGSDNAASRGEW